MGNSLLVRQTISPGNHCSHAGQLNLAILCG